MTSRKTIAVSVLLERANAYLKAKHTTKEGRQAIASMIEGVLLDTNNYAGFGYAEGPYVEGKTDETRRVYYTK